MLKKISVILILFVLCVNMFIISSYAFTADDLPLSLETSTGKVYDILSYPNPPSSFSYTDVMLMADDNNFFLCFFNKDDIYYHSRSDANLFLSFSGNKSICYYQVNVSHYKQPYKSDYFYFNGYTHAINIGKSEFSFFSSCDILGDDGTVVIKKSVDDPHFITSKEDLASGKFDFLEISPGNLNNFDDEFGFAIFDSSLGITKLRPLKSFVLNYYSNYCDNSNSDIVYYIPKSDLGIDFSNGKKYMFTLSTLDGLEVYNSINFEVGNLTFEDELKNKQDLTNSKIDEQTNAIKEQTETNKNIFEKIGEMLSYINPFSENFFVYKLLELLGEMLKSLFVPSEDFMSKWFTDISDYFADAFGILYYPVDLVIQVLGRFSNISVQEPIISFGSLSLFGHVIIQPYSYNFNSLLTNDIFKNLHTFYLIVIDVILWLGLLVYCKNVIANIFGGKFTDDVIDEIQDPRWIW